MIIMIIIIVLIIIIIVLIIIIIIIIIIIVLIMAHAAAFSWAGSFQLSAAVQIINRVNMHHAIIHADIFKSAI